METTPPLTPKKKLVFTLVTIAILAVVIELFSYVLIALAPSWYGQPILRVKDLYAAQAKAVEQMFHPRPEAIAEFDPQLGWRTKADSHSANDNINARGMRSTREYDALPAEGTLRIAAFGDSFTYATGVKDDETWAAQVEKAGPEMEVLNFGVPGYGIDQALLRFRAMKDKLHARVVVLGAPPVSAVRIVNRVVVFRMPQPFTFSKPRFLAGAGGKLELLPNPVQTYEEAKVYVDHPERLKELGEHDYWYDPLVFENPLYDVFASMRVGVSLWNKVSTRYFDKDRPLRGPPKTPLMNTESESFALFTGIVDAFVEEVRAAGAEPIVLIYPDLASLKSSGQQLLPTHQPLNDYCRVKGHPCLDAMEVLRGAPDPVALFLPDQHYTAATNQKLARWLLPKLKAAATSTATTVRTAGAKASN